jgi:hypothetical protein
VALAQHDRVVSAMNSGLTQYSAMVGRVATIEAAAPSLPVQVNLESGATWFFESTDEDECGLIIYEEDDDQADYVGEGIKVFGNQEGMIMRTFMTGAGFTTRMALVQVVRRVFYDNVETSYALVEVP